MNKCPTISVIMSVYRPVEIYLRKAIESILRQAFHDFEFIIILDGLDEKAYRIVNSYQDERIIIYQNHLNLGLTKSLNLGLQQSRGKYIARMDADDIASANRLEEQFEYMEANPDVAVCGSYAKNIGLKGFTPQLISSDDEILKIRMMFYNAGIIHPTAFIRKQFLTAYNIKYDETILRSQDYALWVDILQYGKIKLLPKVLLGYRRHDEQIISSKKQEVHNYTNEIRIRNWKRVGVEFTETEKKILNSISSSYVEDLTSEYNELFCKLLEWNKINKIFNEKIFESEIIRLWVHLAVKKIKNHRKVDMLLKVPTLKLLIPRIFFYSVKYYLYEKNRPFGFIRNKQNGFD